MGAPWIYELYDNGELLTVGTLSDLRRKIGYLPDAVNKYAKDGESWLGRYTFVHIAGNRSRPVRRKIIMPNYKPMTKNQRLQYVYEELKRSGVTCLGDRERAEDFLEYLAGKGVEASVRYGKERNDHGRVKKYPILEIKK